MMITRKDARQLLRTDGVRDLERRWFLRQGLNLGALTLLTGCDITDGDAMQSVLNAMSRWNDRVQAALFTHRLMPTYPDNEKVAHMVNYEWWADNTAQVQRRFGQWVQS